MVRFFFLSGMIGVFWKKETRPFQWHQCSFSTHQLFSIFTSIVYAFDRRTDFSVRTPNLSVELRRIPHCVGYLQQDLGGWRWYAFKQGSVVDDRSFTAFVSVVDGNIISSETCHFLNGVPAKVKNIINTPSFSQLSTQTSIELHAYEVQHDCKCTVDYGREDGRSDLSASSVNFVNPFFSFQQHSSQFSQLRGVKSVQMDSI
jgi:hypothetical protein